MLIETSCPPPSERACFYIEKTDYPADWLEKKHNQMKDGLAKTEI